jgi:HK97 family phage prohead protease
MFQILTSWDAPRYPPRYPDPPSAEQRAAAAIAAIDGVLAADTLRRIDGALSRVRVELRSAATETVDVDQATRIIRVICVPWDSPTTVQFRGAVWRESFSPGAFDGIDRSGTGVRVNRGHDRGRTVGKVISFDPSDTRGLIAEIRIARTVLGDESLALAEEGCLSCSIGFMIPAGGEQLDPRTRSRRIVRAELDHVALVEDPAYQDASVLSAVG